MHLTSTEQNQLYILLKEFKDLFNAVLDRRIRKPYHIELKPGDKPYDGQPYPVPQVCECTTQMEIDVTVWHWHLMTHQ